MVGRPLRPLPRAAIEFGVALVAFGLAGCDAGGDPCEAEWQNPSGFDDDGLGAELQAILDDNLGRARTRGATLTVHLPERGTFVAASGVRQVSGLVPMLPRTRFRVGSITKTFVAATALRLEEEGVWSLDDTVASYLPDLGLDPTITLRQLLQHQAGIFNFTDDESFLNFSSQPWTPEEVVAWSLDHDDPFAPGETYHYSNTGYFLVALAMDEATGRTYAENVRDYLVAPLELDDTSDEYSEGRDCGMSKGYVIRSDVTDAMNMVWAWAAGGMVSSGVDLCRWAEAVYRGDVLSPSARAEMIESAPISIGVADARYGYGIGTRHTTRGGREVIGHTGSTMGFKGELFIDPASGACVALLTNDFTSVPSEISRPAWDAVVAALP